MAISEAFLASTEFEHVIRSTIPQGTEFELYFGARLPNFLSAFRISLRLPIATLAGGTASRKAAMFAPLPATEGKMTASIPFSTR